MKFWKKKKILKKLTTVEYYLIICFLLFSKNILSLWIFGLLFISSSAMHDLSSIPESCMSHFAIII